MGIYSNINHEMFYSAKEMWNWAYQYCYDSNVKKIAIRTYGAYIGVDEDGDVKATFKDLALFRMMQEFPCTILMGSSDVRTDAFDNHLIYAQMISRECRDVKIRMSPNDHTKLVLFDTGVVIIGGMNLSLSTWRDFGMVIDDPDVFATLRHEFNNRWANCKDFEI